VEKTKYTRPASGLKPDRGHIGHQAAKLMKRSKAIEVRRADAIEEKSAAQKLEEI
jgi:lincosamide and streptogramin A transport system ATP-binding/permease protein